MIRHGSLSFREYTKDDFDLLKPVFTNEKVMQYTLDDCFSEEAFSDYFHKILQNNIAKNRSTSVISG